MDFIFLDNTIMVIIKTQIFPVQDFRRILVLDFPLYHLDLCLSDIVVVNVCTRFPPSGLPDLKLVTFVDGQRWAVFPFTAVPCVHLIGPSNNIKNNIWHMSCLASPERPYCPNMCPPFSIMFGTIFLNWANIILSPFCLPSHKYGSSLSSGDLDSYMQVCLFLQGQRAWSDLEGLPTNPSGQAPSRFCLTREFSVDLVAEESLNDAS